MFDFRDYQNGIYAFDAGYVRPILAAIHMIVESGRVAFVDTGSNDSLPNALAALDQLGLKPDAVDYVILTHIHLDHAGGAGTMMAHFPNAKLVVHPRGARHMANPEKLVAGVSAVYGADYVECVYGQILPVAPDRIVEAPEGYRLSLAGRTFRCIDAPGHARHHLCLVDERTGGIFTGDVFGLSYRELDVNDREFIFPTTSPSQFDPTEMRNTISRLLSLNPPCLYLTHYSRVKDVESLGADLLRRLDDLVKIGLAHRDAGEPRHQRILDAITAYLLEEVQRFGCRLPRETLVDIWATDLELNAQGIEVWLDAGAPL